MDTQVSSLDSIVVVGALAFTAGFADASSFVGADGIFCAHVTGNFVVLAADLARHARADEWLKLATFPIFVVSVLTTSWVYRRSYAELGQATARRLLALEATLFGAAAAVGMVAPASAPGVSRAAVVALLVTAMGIQNGFHRLRPTLGAMTTVMTGNLTQWLVELVMPTSTPDPSKRRALSVVLASFAAGCVGGGWGVAQLGFGALAVPMVFALLARSRIH
jgi:uncharacterized membrane protein YoaK (UPF0700 family)